MRRWLFALIGAVIAAGVVAALTSSQLAAVAACLIVYAVEMIRPDTPREAVMRRALEKEAQEHLYYNLETKRWKWLNDHELEERYEAERRIDDGLRQLEKQGTIDRAAKEGKTIEIVALRQRMRVATANYAGPDRDTFASELDRLLAGLASKYGSRIPVDEAHRLMRKLERGEYSDDLPASPSDSAQI
jgi:hypothetical protein